MGRLLVKEPLSPEWFAARKNRLTASKFNDILNGTPTAWSRLIDEMDGTREGFKGNDATRWGEKYESEAIDLFAFEENLDVEPTGLWVMDEHDFIGGTPDGLIGDDFTVQVKCPYNPEIHLKTWRDQKIPGKYFPQVQGELMVTGRRFVWFISYDPRAAVNQRLVKILIPRNQNFIDGLLARLLQFWECREGFYNPERYFVTAPKIDVLNGTIPKLF